MFFAVMYTPWTWYSIIHHENGVIMRIIAPNCTDSGRCIQFNTTNCTQDNTLTMTNINHSV